jgi:hypothetical protein
MNLKTLALMLPVLWLAFTATFEPSGLPEAMSLVVWGAGLIAAGAGVRVVRGVGATGHAENAREFATATAHIKAVRA